MKNRYLRNHPLKSKYWPRVTLRYIICSKAARMNFFAHETDSELFRNRYKIERGIPTKRSNIEKIK